MTASEIRAEARKKLSGKWGKSALIALIFGLIISIITSILKKANIFGFIVYLAILVPLSYGFIISMMKLNDDTEVGYFDFLNTGLSNFGKAWSVTLQIAIRLLIPFILIFLSLATFSYGFVSQSILCGILGFTLYLLVLTYSIIKQLSYSLAYYVLIDHPEMSSKEAVLKSAELMNGNVWALFCLNLSFIGWAFLCAFTLGIGIFWLKPYIKVSEINFYRNLTGEVDSGE